jgi:hypothetical protein
MIKEAISQIREKKYYDGYAGKKIILLGISFSGKEVKCKFEKI